MFNLIKRYPLMLRFQELRESKYVPFCVLLEKLISSLIDERKLKVHQVTSRVKEINSFSEKIREKEGKYYLLSDVTDLIGIRIITHLDSEVELIENLIKSNFDIDLLNSIDKRINSTESLFGYQSLHLIAKLNAERTILPEFSKYKEIPFEIQIRSILQHAWAEIQHDINYKSQVNITSKTKRKIHRVAALLEQADEIFSEISLEVSNIESQKSLQRDIQLNTPLTAELLGALLETDERLIELQRALNFFNDAGINRSPDPIEIVSLRLIDLNKAEIYTFGELDTALEISKNYIKDFMSLILMDEAYESDKHGYEFGGDVYYRSACLSYLCEFTLGLKKDHKKLLKFLIHRGDSEEYESQKASAIIAHIERLNVV